LRPTILSKAVLWVLLSTVLSFPTFAQSFEMTAERFVSSYTSRGQFRGAVLIAQGGKVLYQKSYGNAVESWGIANSPNTRFEIASLTKQFTGAAILLLAQDGKINVDDPVTKYLPEAPETWKEITIKQVVTHTSGLPGNEIADFTKGICTPYTKEELLATFKNRPLKFKPGTKWAYTNTEYYLLAFIIESVSGETYAHFLTDHIFKPLGMSNSGFASTLAVVPNMAEGYARDGESLRHRDYFDRSLEVGAGGIYSTASDLLRWSDALSHEGLLKQKSLDLMFTPSSPGGYGFGWFIDKTKQLKEYHEGSDPGFAAFEIRYPDQKAFVIVLSNLEDAPVRVIANGLGDLLLTGKIAASQK